MTKLLEIIWNEILNLLKFMQNLLFKIPQKESDKEEVIVDMEEPPVIEKVDNHLVVKNEEKSSDHPIYSNEDRERALHIIHEIYKSKGIDLGSRYPGINCPVQILKLGVEEGIVSKEEVGTILQNDLRFMDYIFKKNIKVSENIIASQERIGSKIDNLGTNIKEMREDSRQMREETKAMNSKMDEQFKKMDKLMELFAEQPQKKPSGWRGMA